MSTPDRGKREGGNTLGGGGRRCRHKSPKRETQREREREKRVKKRKKRREPGGDAREEKPKGARRGARNAPPVSLLCLFLAPFSESCWRQGKRSATAKRDLLARVCARKDESRRRRRRRPVQMTQRRQKSAAAQIRTASAEARSLFSPLFPFCYCCCVGVACRAHRVDGRRGAKSILYHAHTGGKKK